MAVNSLHIRQGAGARRGAHELATQRQGMPGETSCDWLHTLQRAEDHARSSWPQKARCASVTSAALQAAATYGRGAGWGGGVWCGAPAVLQQVYQHQVALLVVHHAREVHVDCAGVVRSPQLLVYRAHVSGGSNGGSTRRVDVHEVHTYVLTWYMPHILSRPGPTDINQCQPRTPSNVFKPRKQTFQH